MRRRACHFTSCDFAETAHVLWERGQVNTHPVFAALFVHKVLFSTAGIEPFIAKALFAISLVKPNPSSPVSSSIMVSSSLIFLLFSLSSLVLHFSQKYLSFLSCSPVLGKLAQYLHLVHFLADLLLRWKWHYPYYWGPQCFRDQSCRGRHVTISYIPLFCFHGSKVRLFSSYSFGKLYPEPVPGYHGDTKSFFSFLFKSLYAHG